jgi:hypothetical protein
MEPNPLCTAKERTYKLENRSESPAVQAWPASQETGVSLARVSWHGWPDCYLLSNGLVEAIVVPAIGRVMRFGLAGDVDGAFWQNRALDGKLHSPAANEWMNFGGDKCWPAPQSAWPEHQGRDWPPPVAFDSRPVEAVAVERGVVLTSPVDPGYGIQVIRRVELDPAQPVMRILTGYRKLSGAPVTVGIWTITQMREPERIFMLLPEHSSFGAEDRGPPALVRAPSARLRKNRRRRKQHGVGWTQFDRSHRCRRWAGRISRWRLPHRGLH